MWVERKANAFDLFNYVILAVMSACFLYPVVMTLALSFSDADKLGNATVSVWPVGYSLNAYRLLLADDRILRFYLNTINYAGTGTLIMLISTSMMAYPLTFRDFRGVKLVSIVLVISLSFRAVWCRPTSWCSGSGWSTPCGRWYFRPRSRRSM